MLVVDDEKISARIHEELFSERGYDVLVALVAKATPVIKTSKPDLAFGCEDEGHGRNSYS